MDWLDVLFIVLGTYLIAVWLALFITFVRGRKG